MAYAKGYGDPINFLYDNQAAMDIAKSLVQHDCTKYIETDRNFIKESLKIALCLILHPTEPRLLIANILTKAFLRTKFEDLNFQVGIDQHLQPNLRGSINIC